jgi:hypothetical protein
MVSSEPITARQGMQLRDSQEKATSHVLEHVQRAKDSLGNIHADNLSADGVFLHPKRQLVSLKIAREELDKAITV